MSILKSTRKMTTNEKMCYDMGYAQGKQDAAPVVRGKWIKRRSSFEQYEPSTCECSECHKIVQSINGTPFCPNCGAKMEENL